MSVFRNEKSDGVDLLFLKKENKRIFFVKKFGKIMLH